MRRSTFAVGAAAVVAVTLSIPSALQAHDNATPRGAGGSMMGPGNMMGMGQMMDHCNRMMQGASRRPNEQWRDGSPPAGGQTEKKQ
ncbi:hypothetical protein SAMN02745126_04810 [Enhydrobacter aerosaccus]|uniref:Pentapeptide MXKDX repeat protein n=1 Tax=Enhydrobacter aerosaccus TaxID=225324 RepID=A0A1T4SK89_9HYPH|nr:hypothetical protein [Enhydrobacter aerosaccus]SKA28629.1 hypothetical protein SAMN02745126_04810 [Enhydrobacter aerosaccus]